MNLNLTKKRALVCGGSRGLGLASAHELALMGADVILLSRSEDRLEQALAQLSRSDEQQHSYLICDMADSVQLQTAVRQEIENNGAIQILINNTGGPPGGTILDAEASELCDAFNAHIIAGHTLVKEMIPGMTTSGFGRIINIVSTSVRQPIPGLGVSNTIRGSMASWAKTLSAELAHLGITVNNVLPGTTNTKRLTDILAKKAEKLNLSIEDVTELMLQEVPMKRIAEPDEIGAAVAFLASPAASFITGISLPVDGGKIKSI